jgi:hypothetical protein
VPWSPVDDLLVLFTDGLSGTLSADGTGEKGEEIVLAEVAANRGRSSNEIVQALFELTSAAAPSIPSDDRTAIILRS